MNKRMAGTFGVTALLGAVLAASAATAAPPAQLESYGAGGTGTAFQLDLFGENLPVSVALTGAAVTSEPEAAADGAAMLVAGNPVPGEAPSGAPEGEASNESCAIGFDSSELSDELDLGGLDLACVRTSAAVDDGAPAADAKSDSLALEIRAGLLSVEGPLGDLTEPLLDGLHQLIDGLAPVGEGIEEGGLEANVNDLLNSIVDSIEDGDTVLTVSVGDTASSASASAEAGVVGTSAAAGAEITLFPGLPGGPLATIGVGESFASVVRDPVTAVATTDVQPAIVTLETNGLGALGEGLEELVAALSGLSAASLPCDDENPLVDLVCIELASERDLTDAELEALGLDFGEGTVGVAASAVRVQVLGGLAEQLGGPLVGLAFADSAAAANAAVLAEVPGEFTPTEEPERERELPRTGSDGAPVGLLAGLAGAAALGLLLVRRSALT